MSPTQVAVELFGISIAWYGVAFAASLLLMPAVAELVIQRDAKRNIAGFQGWNRLSAIGLVGCGIIIGARLWFLLGASGTASIETVFGRGGMSSFGAILGGGLTVALLATLQKFDARRMLDLIALSAPFGVILIRTGGTINGHYSGGVELGGLTVGVGAVEVILEGCIPAALVWIALISRSKIFNRAGAIAGLFLVAFSVGRATSQTLRFTPAASVATPVALVACMGLFLVGAWLFASSPANQTPSLVRGRSSNREPWVSLTVIPFSLASALYLTGCAPAPKEQIPHFPAVQAEISLSNPNADAQCGCANAAGAYVRNLTNSPKQISWIVATRDTSSNVNLAPIRGSDIVQGGQSKFLGCTVHAPSTQCRFQARYELGTVAAARLNSGKDLALFGATSSPSIATCARWCANQNDPSSGACLPLGVRFYAAVAPLAELVEAAQSGNGTVRKADILSKYGISESNDKCQRGDISTQNGLLVNEGQSDYCVISSEDLPTAMLGKLRLAPTDALKLNTVLVRRMEATPVGDVKALNATRVVTFDTASRAPVLAFDGAGGADLTRDFGGAVLGSARIQVQGLNPQTVIATSNGCIAVDEKK